VVNYHVIEYPVKNISEAYPPDGGHLMKFHRAEFTDNLKIDVGETIELESLRQTVAPPYLMAEKPCEGEIVIGFRDIQTGEVTHRKVIQITAS
jgi:hypothetical protein